MNFLVNIKLGLRLFFKNVSSSLIGVAIMAVGLGLSITMFALVNGIMFSAPKLQDELELYDIEWLLPEGSQRGNAINVRDLRVFQAQNESFEHLAGYSLGLISFYTEQTDAYAERHIQARVSPEFFDLIQKRPILGRTLTEADAIPGTGSTALISYELWQEQFAKSADVIGSSVQLNGNPHTIVGVMPKEFQFPFSTKIWVANDWSNTDTRPRERVPRLAVIGTLKKGINTRKATSELNTIAAQLATTFPETNQDFLRLDIKPFNEDYIGDNQRTILLFLLLSSLLVLLISSANVSNLMLARVAQRQHELALRRTLGAEKLQIIFHVLLEGGLLVCCGLILGLLLSTWIRELIWNTFENNMLFIPYWWHIDLDWKVYSFAIGLMIVSVVGSSLFPAIRALALQANDILKDDARTGSNLYIGKLSKFLVGIQITFSTVLLITSATMIILTDYIANRELPYDADQILSTRYQANASAGLRSNNSVWSLYENLGQQIRALPGVEGVGFSFNTPAFNPGLRDFILEGEEPDQEEPKQTAANIVTPGYFAAMDLKPIGGRLLGTTDIESSQPVCVVNQNFVTAYFKNENPVGKRIRINSPGFSGEVQNADRDDLWTDWMTIVGVVPNVYPEPLLNETIEQFAEVYLPHKQRLSRGMTLLVRSKGDVHRWITPIREISAKEAPLLPPMFGMYTLKNRIDRNNIQLHVTSNIILSFGVASLLMAAIGLYALISFTTLQKRREFGIRTALGAQVEAILGNVFRQIAIQMPVGIVLGLAISIFTISLLKQSFNLPSIPYGFLAYFVGVTLVVSTSCIAVFIPAFKASRINPSEALRIS